MELLAYLFYGLFYYFIHSIFSHIFNNNTVNRIDSRICSVTL